MPRRGRPRRIENGTLRIPLRFKRRPGERALFALVDEQDWRFAAIAWRALRTESGEFYAYFPIDTGRGGKRYLLYLHREVMAAPKDQRVDHRDGNTLDCRRSNLRLATASQNGGNSRITDRNSSGYKGVIRVPKGQKHWRAYIRHEGGQIWLGAFASPEEAAGAYDSAAFGIFGEYARLNAKAE